MSNFVEIYDTTLRDGTQGEGISFSVEDKIRIALKLDSLGFHYIEGGWPGSNPKDVEFFKKIKKENLKNAKICAFGSTRRAKNKVNEDTNIKALIDAETPVVTIFGKSWLLHVKNVLNIDEKTNLDLILDSIQYLKSKVKEVFFDAEHFFDGFKDNANYALEVLKKAQEAKADRIILCDTNGGTLTDEVIKIIKEVKKIITIPLGIHAHNDSDLAVANSLVAVQSGISQVQGTINGYGERCGNANLCSIIPNLKLKLNINCILDQNLKELTNISIFVSELANLLPLKSQPFVGTSAFAHKGGIHVDAINKESRSYEHIQPKLVGNTQRVLISELSGQSNVLYKAALYNLGITKDMPELKNILEEVKKLEKEGYQFEEAEGSFELLIKKSLGQHKKFFELESFRVIVENIKGKAISEATIKLKIQGQKKHTVSEGNGPVNALDNALRKSLEEFYPCLKEMHLADYKVRIIDSQNATKATTRVLIESRDKHDIWTTVGVSENIIDASWQALVDSIEYKLIKEKI
ncbi:MAG: citramalate synthase [bacterium]